ncbi:glycine zipper 2TM domain-containing protein [Immundisolibacter sp.]|uniref:glycine zipper 2TM domain-containing protein n=1 Tax=Immundisolibacter sp. TaxID=1934948 RepID=UPI003F848F5C
MHARLPAYAVALAALTVAASLPGCASSTAGNVYSRAETRQAQVVKYGTVEAIQPVRIEGSRTHIGTVTGAVLGGLAGSTVGGGTGQKAAVVAGAVAGGVAGQAAEERLTRADGLELTVRLENGNVMAIVQEQSAQSFQVGQRVRVIQHNGTYRVSP